MSAKGAYGTTGGDVVRRTWKKPDKPTREAEGRDEDSDDEDKRRTCEVEDSRGLCSSDSHAEAKKKKRDDKAPEESIRLAGRGETVDLVSNLGKTQVVQTGGEASKQPGFYCKVCDAVVRDSVGYLDHINGRKHQRNLGLSMNVQRSTADQVRAKLELLKKKQEEGTKEYDFEARIAELRAKEEAEKQKQREKKKRKRNKTSGPSQDADSGEEQEGVRESAVASTEADEMARIMGFGGFTAKT